MKVKKYSVLSAIIITASLSLGITTYAAVPAVGNHDIGCYEYGYESHERRTPVAVDETFDPSVYGEDNVSFIYVAANGDDATGKGTQDAPYASVHKAASVATLGDTIKVGTGLFDFTESVDIPVGVSLEGEGDGTVFTSTTLTRTDIGGGIALVRLHSEEDSKEYGNQHVSYITFDGQQTAAWAIDVSNRHNVSIHDCRIVDFCEAGVGWHASDLSRQSIEDTNPDVSTVNGTFVVGGRFYNNYLKDNTYFDGWGRGSLFMCGLEDFHIYNNIMIEDVRTSPVGSRGVPLKAWYYSGWMRDIKIHDNDIQRLGSASHSSDGSGWDFAIEMAAPYAGLEIYNNHFIGSVDLNGGVTTIGDMNYDYSVWIHDNTFTADPEPKYDDGTPFYNEEYAFTLERLTQKTIIEYNTVTGYDTVLYFNGRQEISDVTFRYNLCTKLGGQGGSMIRLDGRTSSGFDNHITVKNLAIYNNVFSSIEGVGASGFGIILGQEMGCPWSGEKIEISNNVVDGCIYPYWFSVANNPVALTGLNLENNIIHGENGVSVPTDGVTSFVNEDNWILNDSEWATTFENDWFPAEGSLAIDGGKNITTGLVDLAGNPVPYKSGSTYTVTFDANGYGTAPAAQTVFRGDMATKPADPAASGWTFGGWYTEAACTNAFDFSTPVTADITLYAKWTKNSSSGGGGDITTQYTLTYETNGGSEIASTKHNSGATVSLTATPTKEGFTFTGWYSDPTYTEKITSIKMFGNRTVYAGWGIENPNTGHDCPSAYLKDVDENAWYKEAVDYVVDKGLMVGVAADQFAPNAATTREMIVTILYRLEGQPVVTGASPFDDVPIGVWYDRAVMWAEANGIVEGYGNNEFGPMDNITREQMATILYRYAVFKGYDTSKTADLSGYVDATSISDWALSAMRWANAENLITGRTTTTLVPRGEATRAETAAILMRFIHSEIIGEDNIAEGVIRQLQKEIAFGEQDIVTFFSNGYLESIDIKTQKTAEMLFTCIRNCEGITDLTGVNLEPMALPIEINGQGMGTFREFYITYQETGRFICISFTPEDSERFQEYVMSLR